MKLLFSILRTSRHLAQDLCTVAVSEEQAVQDVGVVVLSIHFAKYPDLGSLLCNVPPEIVVIDISKYYPSRDATITGVDNDKPESVW